MKKTTKIILLIILVVGIVGCVCFNAFKQNKNTTNTNQQTVINSIKVDNPNVFYSFVEKNEEGYTLVLTSTYDDIPESVYVVTHNIDESNVEYDANLGIYKTKDIKWTENQEEKNITKVVIKGKITAIRTTSWFKNLTYLKEIEGIENLDTSNLVDASSMFANCLSLEKIDLSSLDMSKVRNTGFMFENCENLKTIYVSDKWDLSNVTYSINMFANTHSLIGGIGTLYDSEITDATYAHIDGGEKDPGYLSKK